MNTPSDEMTSQHDRDVAEHKRRLRRFEVVGVEYVVPTVLGLIMLAVLLVDQKGWFVSIISALGAFAFSAFVTRRFFIH